MTISREDVVSWIENASILDVNELVTDLEEKFGITAIAAPVAVAGGPSAEAGAAAEEKTDFSVVLSEIGDKKINVIKAVREVTSLGLKEAKGFLVIDIVEDSPAAKYDIRGSDRDVILDDREVKLGGDVVVGIDDMEVRKIDDILVYLEREKSVGDQLRLTIIRDGEIVEVSIILGERPNILESP